jgi:hypothetical protein
MLGSFDLDREMDATASMRAESEAVVPPPSGPAPVADGSPVGREPADRVEQELCDMSLAATRIERIRERYARGVYDSPDVLEAVARRLLTSGDV